MTHPRAPGHPVTASMLLTDHIGRILILRPLDWLRGWQLPGGIVEAEESPREGAQRETRQETGLDLAAGDLVAVEWIQARSRAVRDRLALVFAGPELTPEHLALISLQRDEVTAWRLERPEHARALLHPRIAARIFGASHPGRTLYLETRTTPERTPT
ncbi:NUDIX domain-containing protein [Streptomyces boninensis]|uniref:NUDIX domain-containing protein n=1 Tax=Streptomyces boninensis TaxID=2039455 RepID=UPI003B2259CC